MQEFLSRGSAETSPAHGRVPTERPVEELVRSGVIVLDKPSGPSSHQVAAWVRDLFGVAKAGHGGTLDPHVTGVLPVALEDAAKALSVVKDQDKTYVGVFEFHRDVAPKDVEETCQVFTGDVYQRPPVRSAVVRQLRTRRVHRFEVLEIEGRRALVRVACEGGTYIRKLATDIGTVLGTGAHLAALRRVQSAHLSEKEAVSLHDVQDAWAEYRDNGRDDWLRRAVLPVETLLAPLPKIVVRDNAVDAVCHGAPLGLPGVVQVSKQVQPGHTVVVSTLKGEAVALAQAKLSAMQMVMEKTGVAAKTERVIMRAGTYPKGWSTGSS